MRMMSRQDNARPPTAATGLVSPMMKLSDASSSTRNTKASDRPMARALRACRRPSGAVNSAMNTRLSMPSTISSAVSVSSAAQAFGSDRRSIMSGPARQQADGEEIGGDGDQRPGHVRPRRQIRGDGGDGQHRP